MKENERNEIVERLAKELSVYQKSVLNSREAACYLGLSLSRLYKLTASKQIPHFKPGKKNVFFDRAELDAWRLQNRIATGEELAAMARTFNRG